MWYGELFNFGNYFIQKYVLDFFPALSGISTLVEVCLQPTYPIRWNRLWAQEEDSKTRSAIAPGCCLINPFAADVATDRLMTEPWLEGAVI